MNETESEEAYFARVRPETERIAEQAVLQLLAANNITAAEYRAQPMETIERAYEGEVPAICWDVESDIPEEKYRVMVAFGNLARGLCYHVFISGGNPIEYLSEVSLGPGEEDGEWTNWVEEMIGDALDIRAVHKLDDARKTIWHKGSSEIPDGFITIDEIRDMRITQGREKDEYEQSIKEKSE